MTPSDQSDSQWRVSLAPGHGTALDRLIPEDLLDLLGAILAELKLREMRRVTGR